MQINFGSSVVQVHNTFKKERNADKAIWNCSFLQTISIVKFKLCFIDKSYFIPFNILCRTLCGEIHVTWELLDCGTPNEQGIVGYDISWINMADGSEETASVSHAESSYDVPVYTQG